jgi:DNA-directed RNA polymerase specialized sigma24 family protein
MNADLALLARAAAPVLLLEARAAGLDRDDAEEVVQEALLGLILRGAAPPRALKWLRWRVRRDALARAAALRAERSLVEALREVPAPPASDPVAALTLADALDQLPRGFGRLLVARYAEGWSETEAARIAGLPPGSARIWIRRARVALRVALRSTADSPARRASVA